MGQTPINRRFSDKERSREKILSEENGDTIEVSGTENIDHHIEKGKSFDIDGNLDFKVRKLSLSSWSRCRFDKPMKLMKPEDERCSKTCVSHGSISVLGRQRVQEDVVMVIPRVVDGGANGSYDFFGVYEGRGEAKVAIPCRDEMQEMLEKAMENKARKIRGLSYWEEVIKLCFANMDMELKATGSNAAVVLVGEEEIVVANSGDSCRVVLCHDGMAISRSLDRQNGRHYKRVREEVADGQVMNWNVLNRDNISIFGVSSTSRSKEPEVLVSNRTEPNEFLIVATKGLWNVISEEMACQVARMCFAGLINRRFEDESTESCSADVALMLVRLALDRGSKNNISVIVVELKKMNPNLVN